MDRPSTFTVSPYVPREHPTYTTHGQPTHKSLQTQAGAGREPPADAMRCGRMRRGKQHLLPDAHLCMKGSLLDRFPCRNRGFSSLSTFGHLTALSKMTSVGWKKRETVRPLTLCVFHQLDHSTYSHTMARRWRRTKDGVPVSSHPWQRGTMSQTVGDTATARAGVGRQTLFLSFISVRSYPFIYKTILQADMGRHK